MTLVFPLSTVLKDGQLAYIRPLLPADKEVLELGFDELSDRSRYRRFLTLFHRLTEQQLAYLTEIDQWNHVALLAVVIRDSENIGGGVARYIRLPDSLHTAEPALTVTDSIQNLGLGTILFDLLCLKAREDGLHHFEGHVLPENRPIQSILLKAGAELRYDAGVMRVWLDLETRRETGAEIAQT